MKLIIGNPYDYNYVAEKAKNKVITDPTITQVIENPLFNFVGKYLGIHTNADWKSYHDKVVEIANWGKDQAKSESTVKVVNEIKKLVDRMPSMADKKILDVSVAVKLAKMEKAEKGVEKK